MVYYVVFVYTSYDYNHVVFEQKSEKAYIYLEQLQGEKNNKVIQKKD